MTNSNFGAIPINTMFLHKLVGNKKNRKLRVKETDQVAQQVKEVLQKSDQKLILMVRG